MSCNKDTIHSTTHWGPGGSDTKESVGQRNEVLNNPPGSKAIDHTDRDGTIFVIGWCDRDSTIGHSCTVQHKRGSLPLPAHGTLIDIDGSFDENFRYIIVCWLTSLGRRPEAPSAASTSQHHLEFLPFLSPSQVTSVVQGWDHIKDASSLTLNGNGSMGSIYGTMEC